jgi:hypothetical protein
MPRVNRGASDGGEGKFREECTYGPSNGRRSRPDKGCAVPSMPLERIGEPVLVVHHEQDGCGLCAFADGPAAMTCP